MPFVLGVEEVTRLLFLGVGAGADVAVEVADVSQKERG
jgi:hypothetical protein